MIDDSLISHKRLLASSHHVQASSSVSVGDDLGQQPCHFEAIQKRAAQFHASRGQVVLGLKDFQKYRLMKKIDNRALPEATMKLVLADKKNVKAFERFRELEAQGKTIEAA